MQGTPGQIGLQHGYLLASEIVDFSHVIRVETKQDSDMAAGMSFVARAGHPCGENFYARPFLAAHPEYAWEKPIPREMIAGPWTEFKAGLRAQGSVAVGVQ